MRISDWSSDVCSSDLIENAWLSAPNRTAEFVKNYRLKTDLTITKIQDSFASPEAMSFWELPEFIATLEAAGFSGHRHRLHYYTLLVYPLLLCSMVLIAAVVTLRRSEERRGGKEWVSRCRSRWSQ